MLSSSTFRNNLHVPKKEGQSEAAAHLAHLKKLDIENEEFEKRMGYGKYDSPEERWRKLNPPIKRPDKK